VANDDKDGKKSARAMMRMVRSINEAVEALPKTDHQRAAVACETCHRGLPEPPRPLGDILAEKALAGGPDAALAEYNRLHVEAGDAGQYDFRERALNTAARRLREQKRLPDAIALLRKNVSLFPNSSDTAAMLGMALAESGDVEGARSELQRALALDPDNRFARGPLERLKPR
jgi:tetratricopeptide (TPR) repeat protein